MSGTALAQVLEPVFLTGDATPDLPGGVFTSIGGGSLSPQGELAFDAWANTPSGTTRGVWQPDGVGGWTLVLKMGDVAPGTSPPLGVANLFWPTVDDQGRVAFWVNVGGPPVEKTLYVTNDAGGLIKLTQDGQAIPGAPAGTVFAGYPGAPTTQIDPAGEVAAEVLFLPSGGLPGNEQGALVGPDGAGGVELLYMFGDAAVDVPGAQFSAFGDALLDDAGRVAFIANLLWQGSVTAANDTGAWAPDGLGGHALIAREGDASPVPARAYGEVRSLTGNAAGDLAFSDAVLVGGSSYGVWRHAFAGNALEYESGQLLPGSAQLEIMYIEAVAMDASGRLLLRAIVTDLLGLVPDFDGYWLEDGTGGLDLVAGTGQPAPIGSPGVFYDTIELPQLNAAGELVFRALLTGTGIDPSNDRVVMARGLDGSVRPLLREGDAVEIAPSDVRTVTSVFVYDGERAPFKRRQLSDTGDVIVSAAFGDGSSGLLRTNLRAVSAVPGLGRFGALALALLLTAGAEARLPRRAT